VILDNSQEAARAAVANNGSFSIPVTLQTGDNQLTAYAIAPDQQQSAVSQSYLVNYSTTAPKLTITNPQDKQSFVGSNNQQLKISGMTDPNVRVTLNNGFLFVNADGSFNASYQLTSGDNYLDFIATNSASNQSEQKLTVHYSN
jgi:bacillopeptidase F